MKHLGPIALARHRRFGAAMAEEHFAAFPSAMFGVGVVLPIMRECLGPIAADEGTGSAALEPLARATAAAFLREWRRLSRAHDD